MKTEKGKRWEIVNSHEDPWQGFKWNRCFLGTLFSDNFKGLRLSKSDKPTLLSRLNAQVSDAKVVDRSSSLERMDYSSKVKNNIEGLPCRDRDKLACIKLLESPFLRKQHLTRGVSPANSKREEQLRLNSTWYGFKVKSSFACLRYWIEIHLAGAQWESKWNQGVREAC